MTPEVVTLYGSGDSEEFIERRAALRRKFLDGKRIKQENQNEVSDNDTENPNLRFDKLTHADDSPCIALTNEVAETPATIDNEATTSPALKNAA